MSWPLIAFTVLLIATILTVPAWPFSRRWGYVPSLVLLVATLLVGFKVFGVMH